MKIFAIGMNYAEHNKSLHGTLSKPERPVIFTKADSALLNNGKPFFIPDHLGRIEYETELVVRICTTETLETPGTFFTARST